MKQTSFSRLSALLVLLALLLGLGTACSPGDLETLAQTVSDVATLMESADAAETPTEAPPVQAEAPTAPEQVEAPAAPEPEQTEAPAVPAPEQVEAPAAPEPEQTEAPAVPAPEPAEEFPEEPAVVYGNKYSTPEDVALYLHLYQELPPNYLTKNDARDMGWDNSEGNLWDVAPGSCIGGDRFGNYEGLLPEGRWTECDVNYEGGYRNAERLVWNEDGAIYYTNDHYQSFTQLYEGWAE